MINKRTIHLAAVILVGFNLWVWHSILAGQILEDAVYFLDVGQGDSQLITLSSGSKGQSVKILIDGGRNKKVLNALDAALGKNNNAYIDIVILSNPDLDHFGGIIEIAARYDIGLFVSSGYEKQSADFYALQKRLAERNVPTIALEEGDIIRYRRSGLFVLSPDRALIEGGDTNDASIVIMLASGGSKALFTGDIGFSTEEALLAKGYDLKADILKVGHHGSKNSSGENFIASVRPLVSVIGVGQNRYGHPAPQVLKTLELAGSHIYRTDNNGTVKIILDKGAAFRADSGFSSFVAAVAEIMTAGRKNTKITALSLSQIKEKESRLVPYTKCSFWSASPSRTPIIINEVAWMGSEISSTHEWIELKNVSGKAVDVSGWQLLNANERIRITFPQQTIFEKRFIVLARSAANDVLRLNADLVFAGAIRNTKEGLRLFDNNCQLIDEVFASPNWTAGDNRSKQTMERTNSLSWETSASAGGTPGSENSTAL